MADSKKTHDKKIGRFLSECYDCKKGGPEKSKCANCRWKLDGDGVYKYELVEALLYGYKPFKGGGKLGRTTLSLSQQKKVLKELAAGKPITKLAEEMKVSYRTLKRLENNQKSEVEHE